MKCLALLLLLCAGACTTDTPPVDDRPQTLEFITQAILKPNCGTAECHSSMKRQSTDAFDSVEATRASFDLNTDLVVDCPHLSPPQESPCLAASSESYLVTVMTIGTRNENELMPLDQGMSRVDIDLIATWIQNGAQGYTVKDRP